MFFLYRQSTKIPGQKNLHFTDPVRLSVVAHSAFIFLAFHIEQRGVTSDEMNPLRLLQRIGNSEWVVKHIDDLPKRNHRTDRFEAFLKFGMSDIGLPLGQIDMLELIERNRRLDLVKQHRKQNAPRTGRLDLQPDPLVAVEIDRLGRPRNQYTTGSIECLP